jgi:hypothetical protein
MLNFSMFWLVPLKNHTNILRIRLILSMFCPFGDSSGKFGTGQVIRVLFCFQAGAHLDLNVVVMVQKAFTDDDCQEFMEQQQPIYDDKNGYCPKWHINCAIHKFIK